jgi:hypothetical protein
MKKLLLVLAIGAFAACNNGANGDTKTDSTTVVKDSTKMTMDSSKMATDSSKMMSKDTSKMAMDTTKKK